MTAGGSIVAGGVNDLILNAGESGTPDIYLQSGGSTKVKIEGSNGNVGINTSSPTHLLQISGGVSDGRMSFTNNARGNGQTDGMWVGVDNTQSYLLSRGAYPLNFYTNATERMRISSAGNVGIGNSIASSFHANANNLVIGTGSGSEGMTIYGGGESNIFFADGTAGSSAYVGRIEYSHAVDNMLFYVNNSNAMTIDDSGNLLVSGTVRGGVETAVTSTSTTITSGTHLYVSAAGQTITLPASPSQGAKAHITVGNFTDTVVARNGSNIMGDASDMTLDAAYLSIQFIYVDATRGWVMA